MTYEDIRHGYHVFRDGDGWTAVGPAFVDREVSPVGFGNTPNQAVANWQIAQSKRRRPSRPSASMRSYFLIHAEDECLDAELESEGF